jgi:uncharacterized zinc-type alcohol dehydrogenase-like protein
MVPGHEIAGVVAAVGKNVTKFKVGQSVGVGCMVDSCKGCAGCRAGDEQYCRKGFVGTYNGRHMHPHHPEFNEEGGAPTYGGYSQDIVVNQDFVLSIPSNLDQAAAAPLLCAGITVYAPMVREGLLPNMKLGVAGLGGLGHMAVKFGVAMGCEVTVFSRGKGKKSDALVNLGAHHYVDTKDAKEVEAAANSIDFMVNTIPAVYDIHLYLGLLKHSSTMVIVGGCPEPIPVQAFGLIFKNIRVVGSLIGGVQITQEMLDFCGRHNITCEIEKIEAKDVNTAWDRTCKGDVKYRFVIDTSTI